MTPQGFVTSGRSRIYPFHWIIKIAKDTHKISPIWPSSIIYTWFTFILLSSTKRSAFPREYLLFGACRTDEVKQAREGAIRNSLSDLDKKPHITIIDYRNFSRGFRRGVI